MDFLAAEIARKRKEIATTKASTDSPNKKYIRQKDVAAERDKRYLEGQARLTAEREAKAAAKLEETRAREAARLAREERLRREKEAKLPEPEAKKEVGDDKVQERLRELEEPRVAFGETVEERRRRLEDVEMRVAVEKKRAARMAARAEEAPELERLENLTPDAEELRVKLGDVKGNPNRLYDQLYQYFKVICQEWTKSMDERDEEVKESPEGREALRIHLQCLEDFRPLFRALKRKNLEADVFPLFAEIMYFAQQREYLKAADAYYRLSIGNAAWPIGVVAVGIHERSSADKIQYASHVFNDEGTRKWVQGVKRWLTFAQAKWPPEDRRRMMG